jgi:ATP-dependent DNA helicase RecG
MTTLDQLTHWLSAPAETEHLEFKEAKEQFDLTKLKRYCVALANEGGGTLILGVTDGLPRRVVGTSAFSEPADIAGKLFVALRFRVDVEAFDHSDVRVLIFHIPGRPKGTAYNLEGAYWMRSTHELVAMSEDRLREIFAEGKEDWLSEPARGIARLKKSSRFWIRRPTSILCRCLIRPAKAEYLKGSRASS